jgi:hypothetical protein
MHMMMTNNDPVIIILSGRPKHSVVDVVCTLGLILCGTVPM